jgi:hypothetical protein
MTLDEVQEIIRLQSGLHLTCTNDHGISLKQALVVPQKVSVIVRMVKNGRVNEQKEAVWLVGKEDADNGYRIVMREDGCVFGLASTGFPTDEHLVLVGWHGSVKSAFLSM